MPAPLRRLFPEGQILASESEVARAFNKTPLTMWRWRKRGVMPPAVHLNGGVSYFCDHIEEMIARGLVPPDQEQEFVRTKHAAAG